MIYYQTGDATDPDFDEAHATALILHICNSLGVWGGGFTGALSQKWRAPERRYKEHVASVKQAFETDGPVKVNYSSLLLGTTQSVKVEEGIHVINMIAQAGVRGPNNPRPLSDGALLQCLEQAARRGRSFDRPEFHMPRIGCGLAGGKWSEVEPLIADALLPVGPVIVYDLPENQ